MSFVHLHVHTAYSLLDGACRIKDTVSYAKSMGMNALAVTDHGNMFAVPEFYKECVKQGIKPIIGCEAYIARRSRYDREPSPYHLILLCKNETGYKNLIKLCSLAYTEGFYSKPRMDRELLERYSEGLICLSGCIAGEIPRYLLAEEEEKARETALYYNSLFGEGNYYLEVQNHGLSEDALLLSRLYRLSDETGIPLAATNDAHYVRKSDAGVQNILLSIQTNTTLDRKNPLSFPNDEFYLKSEEEMLSLFRGRQDAVENTARIAQLCTFEMSFGETKLPRYDPPENIRRKYGRENKELLSNMCRTGLEKRYGREHSREIDERLSFELSVITGMGYTDYYLIVWDFIHYARSRDIPVGPGRGSGAGSLAAYCIGITDIDPIKYNLLFERFLNPERVSLPDFDIDFCYERRQEVIDYVVERYGEERVAQIVTFGTMGAKAAVRDTARIMGLPYSLGDTVSKLIPQGLHITLEKALEESPELKKLYDADPRAKALLSAAGYIEGMPRNTSTHAAGVVICDAPVSDYVPVLSRDGAVATQYTMTALEEIGLLKMDFLGLRNLTIIRDCEKMIQKNDPSFRADRVPENDVAVFEMLSKGDVIGVFQFESGGMKQLLMNLKPVSVEDLIAALSLYRPGPMDSIPKYLENRRNPDKITYAHPILKDILEVTCGCIVYQEQVMEICRKMAGYSYGRADTVRRAMAKKKQAEMEKERDVFINGAVKNGVSRDTAAGVFEEMSRFASYAFNKSHAAAYSVVAYRTAYLKCRYLKEYMAALMTAFADSTEKLMEYISLCRKRGINILPPDINKSMGYFLPCSEGIRFSLNAVKGLGFGITERIIAEREENGEYKSLTDIIGRLSGRDFSRKTAESLIKSGALDGLPLNRRLMLENYELIASGVNNVLRGTIEGQLDFFGENGGTADTEADITPADDFTLEEKLEMEKEFLGIYVSGHPLYNLRLTAAAARFPDIAAARALREGTSTAFVCVLRGIKQHNAKSGAMAFAEAEDMGGSMELVIFPKVYALSRPLIVNGSKVLIEGKLSVNKDGEPSLIADRIVSGEIFAENISRTHTLYIRAEGSDKEFLSRCGEILSEYPGNSPVLFKIAETGKLIAHKRIKTVNICPPLLERLNSLAGESNILLRGKM